MTVSWRDKITCPVCGHEFSSETPLNVWIRNHPELRSGVDHIDITDGDKCVKRYMMPVDGVHTRDVQCEMMIELKAFGKNVPWSQLDTLKMMDQLLRSVPLSGERENGRFIKDHKEIPRHQKVWSPIANRMVWLKHYGWHVLTVANSTPDDSDWISWDGKKITIKQMVKLFRFEIHPDTLRPEILSRKHKLKPRLPLIEEIDRKKKILRIFGE